MAGVNLQLEMSIKLTLNVEIEYCWDHFVWVYAKTPWWIEVDYILWIQRIIVDCIIHQSEGAWLENPSCNLNCVKQIDDEPNEKYKKLAYIWQYITVFRFDC